MTAFYANEQSHRDSWRKHAARPERRKDSAYRLKLLASEYTTIADRNRLLGLDTDLPLAERIWHQHESAKLSSRARFYRDLYVEVTK